MENFLFIRLKLHIQLSLWVFDLPRLLKVSLVSLIDAEEEAWRDPSVAQNDYSGRIYRFKEIDRQ
jgi:hypothetical protein